MRRPEPGAGLRSGARGANTSPNARRPACTGSVGGARSTEGTNEGITALRGTWDRERCPWPVRSPSMSGCGPARHGEPPRSGPGRLGSGCTRGDLLVPASWCPYHALPVNNFAHPWNANTNTAICIERTMQHSKAPPMSHKKQLHFFVVLFVVESFPIHFCCGQGPLRAHMYHPAPCITPCLNVSCARHTKGVRLLSLVFW